LKQFGLPSHYVEYGKKTNGKVALKGKSRLTGLRDV